MPATRPSRSPSERHHGIILSEHGIDKISEDDYFLKSDNFRLWLKEDRGKVGILLVPCLHKDKSHSHFVFTGYIPRDEKTRSHSTLMNYQARGHDITLPSLPR